MCDSTSREIKHLGMAQDLLGHKRKAHTFFIAPGWIWLAGLNPPVHLKGPNGEEPYSHHGDSVTE
jgi:hypothetical protein